MLDIFISTTLIPENEWCWDIFVNIWTTTLKLNCHVGDIFAHFVLRQSWPHVGGEQSAYKLWVEFSSETGKWKTFIEACEDLEGFFFSNNIVVCNFLWFFVKRWARAHENWKVTALSISPIVTA
jgi:hypothetical protein